VQIWDLKRIAAPLTIEDDSFGKLSGAAISPDGSLVATSSIGGSGAAILWNAVTGAPRQVLLRAGLASVTDQPGSDIEFSADGRMLATTDQNGTATVWDTRDGRLLKAIDATADAPAQEQSDLSRATFSPDGTRLATSVGSPPVQPEGANVYERTDVWSLASGRRLSQLNGIAAIWSPLGGDIATTSSDGTARVWVANTGRVVSQLKRSDQTPIGGRARFAPDAVDPTTHASNVTQVVTGSQNGSGGVFNAISGTQIVTLAGDTGAVDPVGFSADGNRVLTYSSDGAARLWDTGSVVPRPAPDPRALRASDAGGLGNLHATFGLTLDPLSPLRAIGSYQTPLTIVDVRTGAQVATLPAVPGLSYTAVAFDAAGRVMLVMSYGSAARPAELRLAHGGRLLHVLSGPGSLATGAALSPDGQLVAAVDGQDRIGVWDVASGHRVMTFTGHVGHRTPYGLANVAIKFSPDGSLILSADESGKTFVWNPRTGQVLNRIALAPEPTGMYAGMGGAISPDDRLVVATASWDQNAHVFRIGHSAELMTLSGHASGIDDATFGPDSNLIATIALADGTVRVWDAQHPSPLLTIPEPYIGSRVDFSPDGQSIVTDGATPYETLACIVCGGFGRLLTLARDHETRQLTAEERSLYLSG
jgi:WD40 repeat protein